MSKTDIPFGVERSEVSDFICDGINENCEGEYYGSPFISIGTIPTRLSKASMGYCNGEVRPKVYSTAVLTTNDLHPPLQCPDLATPHTKYIR